MNASLRTGRSALKLGLGAVPRILVQSRTAKQTRGDPDLVAASAGTRVGTLASRFIIAIPLPLGCAAPLVRAGDVRRSQAFFDKPLAFASGPGFANDWLTGWTNAGAKVWCVIDVATAGVYDVEIAFAFPKADAGSRLRIAAGGSACEAVIPAAVAPEIPLPNRDAEGDARCRNRKWATLVAGRIVLPQGPARLVFEPVTMPGMHVMALKHVTLSRVNDR